MHTHTHSLLVSIFVADFFLSQSWTKMHEITAAQENICCAKFLTLNLKHLKECYETCFPVKDDYWFVVYQGSHRKISSTTTSQLLWS